MTRKALGIASAALVLLLLAAALTVGSSLPAELMLPTHWGISGAPDHFSGKWAALLMPVCMTALLSLLFWFLPALEPRGRNLGRSPGLYHATWVALLLVMAAIELVIVSVALRWHLRVEHIMTGTIGLVLVLVGNQLGKSRSMYLVGIRTPWTLASEEVWMKTNRLGGKLMVLGGLLIMVSAFLPLPSGLAAALFGSILALVVIVPAAYSYMLWRRERRGDQPSL